MIFEKSGERRIRVQSLLDLSIWVDTVADGSISFKGPLPRLPTRLFVLVRVGVASF